MGSYLVADGYMAAPQFVALEDCPGGQSSGGSRASSPYKWLRKRPPFLDVMCLVARIFRTLVRSL